MEDLSKTADNSNQTSFVIQEFKHKMFLYFFGMLTVIVYFAIFLLKAKYLTFISIIF